MSEPQNNQEEIAQEQKQEQVEETPEEMLKKVKELQNESKYFDCLELMEKIITQTHQKHGPKSKQYIASQEKMCEICNQVSMLFLTKDKKQLAFEFLKRSETLSSTSPQLQIITFNNFSCYYKKVELYAQASEYLQKAITIGNRNQIYRNLADSYLNLCSINSQLNKHKSALQNALMAIYLLQNEMVNFLDKFDNSQENDETKSKKEIIYVLAVAYHNLGVELEYLKRYDEALAIYEKATKFAVENLGYNHELVSQLKEICSTAKQQIENQKMQQIQKPNKGKQNNAQFYMTQQNLKEMQKQYAKQGGTKNDKQSKQNSKFTHSDAFHQPQQKQEESQKIIQQEQPEQSQILIEQEQPQNKEEQKNSQIQEANKIEQSQNLNQQEQSLNTKEEEKSSQIQEVNEIGKDTSQLKEIASPLEQEQDQKEVQESVKEEEQKSQISQQQPEQQVSKENEKDQKLDSKNTVQEEEKQELQKDDQTIL